MHTLDLANATWTIEACGEMSQAPATVRGRAFPARVPGCVHSDLIHAEVISHPNIGFNEEQSQWIGRTDWRYRCRFEVDAVALAHDRADLVLEGLDTEATIEVNGQPVGEAMNMHHAHRFDITRLLHGEGEPNELIVSLRGPVTYVEEQERRLGRRPVNGDWTPYSYIRKMASNFQWDWGPRVATCGIWRGTRLEAWSGARIASLRPIVVSANASEARVDVHVGIEQAGATPWDFAEITLTPVAPSMTRDEPQREKQIILACTVETGQALARLVIQQPVLWWPRGYGDQPLYAAQVALWRGRERLDEHRVEIGLRETRLLTTPDESGSALTIAVNGVPIFCKGANWIPEGLFPEDQTSQRIRERVQQAADANMNMLRVWGGGTYEQDAFYDACDELGIMVWQDFMFACATYPEDDPYPQLIEHEAREVVTRLAYHPSIVLWCGGNEDMLGYESWGWKQLMSRSQKWGERYFLDILPRVVKELDPSRPYWPDSPYSGSRDVHPNDPDRGDRHTWDAKVQEYRDLVPRFCSEFGHQSPPCWATMQETWGADQLQIDSRAMHHRQRAAGGGGGGNDVWYGPKVMGGRFREPLDFDEWLYLAHLLQARAISTGIEWLRANQPRCMGALFWQLNDAWAGHSWSCIDSAGRRKPLWYAARRAFAPRLLTIQPFDGDLRLCAINETPETWTTNLRIRRMGFDGSALAERHLPATIPPGQCWRSIPLREVLGRGIDDGSEAIVADAAQSEVNCAWWFFRHDVDLRLPEPRVRATITRVDDQWCELTVRADALLRDAVIAVDRVDPAAEIDDNLVTMQAGEQRLFRIRTTVDVPAHKWISPPVFRCVNEFAAST